MRFSVPLVNHKLALAPHDLQPPPDKRMEEDVPEQTLGNVC